MPDNLGKNLEIISVGSLEDIERIEENHPSDDGGVAATERGILIEQLCKSLTQRQRTVIDLFLEGYTQEEIGPKLGIARRTVCDIFLDAIRIMRDRNRQKS